MLRLRKVATKVRQASPFTELAGALSGGVMPLAAMSTYNAVMRSAVE